MKLKRIISVAAAAILAVSAFAGCGSSSSNGSASGSAGTSAETASRGDDGYYHLKLATSPSLCQAPLHVAVQNGFFEEEGIKAEEIQFDANYVQEAVATEQVEAGFGLIGKFLLPIENGLAIKFTSGMHNGCIKILTKQDSGINSIADLKGKTIGVDGLSGAAAIMLKRALAAEGIGVTESNMEVDLVAYSKSDLAQALENGAVAAITTGDPTASIAEKEYDLKVLLNTATDETYGYGKEYCCAAFVTTKLAEEHPDVAAAFTRAVQKASLWVEEHPREAAQIQLDHNYVSGDIDLNASLLEEYDYTPSVQGGYDAVEANARDMAAIELINPDTDPKEFVDGCYIFLDGVPDSPSSDGEEAPAEGSAESTSAQSDGTVSTAANIKGDVAVPLIATEKNTTEGPKDCCQ